MNAADAISKTLRAYGTEYFFIMKGGDQEFIFSVVDAGLKIAPCRSEQSAVYMADGFARISYKPSFVYGQWGPGAGNVAGAMADPFWGCSPVVAITSSMSAAYRGRDDYQELDQMPMFDPVTKWNAYLPAPGRAAEMTKNAIRNALSGCPGTAHLDVPRDYFAQDIGDPAIYSEAAFHRYPALRPSPEIGMIVPAMELLTRAERPLIIAGLGVILSQAWRELRSLAELLSIPVGTTLGGKGSIPENHPLSIGIVGKYSRKSANDIANKSDLILFVGCGVSGLVTNNYTIPQPGTRVIQVDVLPQQIGRNCKVDAPIAGDAKLSLQMMVEAVAQRGLSGASFRPWLEEVGKITSAWRENLDSVAAVVSTPIKPQAALRVLRELIGGEDILVADTGYMAAWTGALFDVLSAGRHFIRATGSLGWALPASLGAKLAAPQKRVVCVIGDGGIGYHMPELETALRLKLPVVVMVFNNRTLAFEYHIEKYLYGRVIGEVNDFLDVDYGKVASAYGANGRRVESTEELKGAIKDGLEADKISLIDVVIDKEEMAPITNYENVVKRRI